MFLVFRSQQFIFRLALLICILGSLAGRHCGLVQAQEATPEAKPDIGGILISPTKHRVDVRAGQRGSLDFKFENPSKERSVAQIELLSYLPADWSYLFQEDAVNPRDASQWFAERKFSIELIPGQKKSLRLSYTVPRGVSGTYWCVMRFIPRPVNSTSPRKIILEVPLIFTIGGRERPVIKVSSPLVTKVYEKSSKSPLLLNLPVINEGLGLAIVGVTGEIKNMVTGNVVTNLSIIDRNVLPLSKRNIAFRMPQLPDGQYRITMRAELGNRRLPPVQADYVFIDNQAKPLTESTVMELPPVFIDPSAINLTAPAGSVRSQALRVVNTSDREITLDITPRALEQATTGGIGLGGDNLPAGLSVKATPQILTLRPKGSAVTRLTLKPEREAQGDLWFGLAITEQNNTNAFSDTIESCLTVVGTSKPGLEVVNGNVEMVDGRPLNVGFTVRNTGNQALLPLASASVLHGGVRLAARLEVPVRGSGGILPGAEITNSVMLPLDLAPGDYVVEIAYQYGEGDDAIGRLRVPIVVPETRAEKSPAATPVQSVKNPSVIPAKKQPAQQAPAAKPSVPAKPKATTKNNAAPIKLSVPVKRQ